MNSHQLIQYRSDDGTLLAAALLAEASAEAQSNCKGDPRGQKSICIDLEKHFKPYSNAAFPLSKAQWGGTFILFSPVRQQCDKHFSFTNRFKVIVKCDVKCTNKNSDVMECLHLTCLCLVWCISMCV